MTTLIDLGRQCALKGCTRQISMSPARLKLYDYLYFFCSYGCRNTAAAQAGCEAMEFIQSGIKLGWRSSNGPRLMEFSCLKTNRRD